MRRSVKSGDNIARCRPDLAPCPSLTRHDGQSRSCVHPVRSFVESELGAPVRESDMSERRTGSPGFFLAHAATGCGYAILSVCMLGQYDGAIGRTASLWLALLTYIACATIGMLAWWVPSRLMVASGRFRGASLLVAVLSGVASMMTLVLFAPATGAPSAWLALAVLVPASLGMVWTALSTVGVAVPPRLTDVGGAQQAA